MGEWAIVEVILKKGARRRLIILPSCSQGFLLYGYLASFFANAFIAFSTPAPYSG